MITNGDFTPTKKEAITFNKVKCACKSKMFYILTSDTGEVIVKCHKCNRIAIKMKANEREKMETNESAKVPRDTPENTYETDKAAYKDGDSTCQK